MRTLVLGASGMLGHAVVRVLAAGDDALQVVAVSRSLDLRARFPQLSHIESITGVDAENTDALLDVIAHVRPACVINCIGVVKQHRGASDPLVALPINAMLPHRLAHLCALSGARLIHISTDCVFQGVRGNYKEDDVSDATDLYGKSKYIGEVGGANAITLRTSIIGPELRGAQGLIEWFLSRQETIRGYKNVIFSGLPTVELARVIRDFVLPHKELSGVFHVAATPISKFDLLSLVAKVYGKDIMIEPDHTVRIDRSLDASRFNAVTGYVAPAWPDLVAMMHAYHYGKE
jgi:dTDP-4-dehydrorhamnose reductase